jgi:superfamily II DNA or RNA helicase
MEKPQRKPRKLRIIKTIPDLTEENIEQVYQDNFKKIDLDDNDYNKFLMKKENLNASVISQNENSYTALYPSLDDPDFNIKLAEKKEFNENKYDGTLYDIEEQATKLCEAEFELSPHQIFVRNFLSFQTPYNSLLLYHGLGTGKTCSAITVAEEMRTYLNQLGINQRIIVVASPNVQENFKLQLFDERKLKLVDGLWNLKACTGNKYLKEINPMNMKGLSKDKVIRQIHRIIKTSYLFVGYTEFANYIQKKSQVEEDDPVLKKEIMIKKLKQHFNNRLVIIDEVHNIRISDEKQDKRVANELFKLVKYVDNLRLLFLSATPMYNSYKEIIWLLNVMNLNDKRSTIELEDVFDKDGNFLIDGNGNNIGEELLRRKATGYVSFIRGENPYTFPYRIFPSLFAKDHTFKELTYPRKQINNKSIIQPLEHLDVFVNTCGSYQEKGYNYILSEIKTNIEKTKGGMVGFENMDSFGYTILQKPLQALNIIYPIKQLTGSETTSNFNSKALLGSEGLKRIMKFTETSNPPTRKNFDYKDKNSEFGEIFSPNNIGKYSSKIKSITDSVLTSDGIVLIYSQFIDGGAVPMALALESVGFSRFGTKTPSLFKTPPTGKIDATTFLTKEQMENPNAFRPATYTMITGDKALSPDKVFDLKNLTDEDNKNGEKIKVVIISMTGAEGIDFKNLRQVHILEPWYNLSLIEQIIGRAVRTCSHKQLKFIERNVEIFLYGTLLNDSDEEAVDLYIYRLAEIKAVQIGRVSRLLKESSIDCILNIDQTKFTEENMNTVVKQQLSNKMTIDFPIGDKANTVSCDYMETCDFKCKPFKTITEGDIKLDTYDESFILMNTEKIIQRIRELFKNRFFYKKENLISEINVIKNYPLVQINSALTILIEDENEYITDKFDRLGHLRNIEDYYLFQPIELNNENISIYDRRNPIDFKHESIIYPLKEIEEPLKIKKNISEKETVGFVNNKLNIIKENLELASKPITTLERGEDNWYVYASMLHHTNYLKDNFNITTKDYELFVLQHILDSLTFTEVNELLDYIYFTNELTEFGKKVKNIYDDMILQSKGIRGIILSKENKRYLLVKGDKKWIKGESEDYSDLSQEIEKLILPLSSYNRYIGFVGNFKNEYNIFKVKDMEDKRGKGARCDQSGKSDTYGIINHILDENKYTSENTKKRKKIEFCVIQELLLRFYNKTEKNKKVWFLNQQESVINNI